MLLFPQLLSGAVAQFPLSRSYSVSNVTNLQEDGTRYLETGLEPPNLSWRLAYQHLTKVEADELSTFFESTHGRLFTFTFLDPVGNLLLWSEDLAKPFWDRSPLLGISALSAGTDVSFELSGTGPGTALLSQALACPAKALLCFSLYARADQPSQINLALSDVSNRVEKWFGVDATWRQYFVTQAGNGAGSAKTAEISLNALAPIQVTRISVNAQPAPAFYLRTTQTCGIKQNTRFNQDHFLTIATGDDDFSCSVQLTSRLD